MEDKRKIYEMATALTEQEINAYRELYIMEQIMTHDDDVCMDSNEVEKVESTSEIWALLATQMAEMQQEQMTPKKLSEGFTRMLDDLRNPFSGYYHDKVVADGNTTTHYYALGNAIVRQRGCESGDIIYTGICTPQGNQYFNDMGGIWQHGGDIFSCSRESKGFVLDYETIEMLRLIHPWTWREEEENWLAGQLAEKIA